MKNLLLLVVALSLSEGVWARGLQVFRARAANRLVYAWQVQQRAAVGHLLQAARRDTYSPVLLLVLADEASKDMPDQKPARRDTTSPDDPDSGKPDWDKPRRGGSSVFRERSSGSARHWDNPDERPTRDGDI